MTDTKEIREAKEAVTEAKENIQIAGMEKEISNLNDIIDDLDKKIEESNKYYDELIEQTEKYWDGLIKGLEEYKSRWKELADIEEQAKMEVMLRNLGITTEDVLNMSGSAFESFKGTYLGLLNEMYYGNDEMQNMLQMFGGIASDTLKPLSGTIGTVARSLDDYAASTGRAGTNTSVASESVGTLSTNTSELNSNLSGVSDNINDILEDNKLETIAEQMGDIAESVQSLSDALNDMPDDMDMSQTIGQFDALGNSVDKVSASISGGNASKADTSDGTSGKNASNAQSNSSVSGSNSLVGAIKEVKSETDRSVGTGEDSGAIGQFNQLGESVVDVTAAIGGSDGGENTDNLISSIENLGETTTETLGEPDGDGAIGRFGEFGDTVAEAEGHVNGIIDGMNELDGMTAECTIKVNVETNGSIPAFAEGTVNTDFESGEFTAQYGHAYAEGTDKYQGLPRAEKNALVSEYGQTEMTVLPNGDTIITDEPTLMDLPKDTVIYNEEQTKKIMDNKVDASGKAYADGTNDEDWWIGADGHRYRHLHEGDEGWDLMKAGEALIAKFKASGEEFMSNAYFEHQKQMEQLTKVVTNNTAINNITNNRNVQQPVVNNTFNITMPNVTNSTAAESLMNDLQSISTKKFQFDWNK